MKKLYMLLSGAAFVACALSFTPSGVSAQALSAGVVPPQTHGGTVSPAAIAKAKNKLSIPHHEFNTAATSQVLIEYWSAQDSLGVNAGSTPAIYYEYMFPDSTVQAGANGYVFLHLAGCVLDPNATWAQQYNPTPYIWDNTSAYTVDSLAIFYNYDRTTDASITDTLVVYYWDNAVSTDINRNYLFRSNSGVPQNYNVDSLTLALVPYDSINLSKNIPKLSPGTLKTMKIPLTEADTATVAVNLGVKVVATNFTVPAGKLFACAYGFKPGYSYSLGDNITQVANDFAFLSSEPNGDPNGDGTGSYGFYENGDWNMSSYCNNQVRYNTSPGGTQGGWDGLLIPSYAFNLGWPFQQNLVSYYVSANYVGINEVSPTGDLKLFQNQPNPANRTTVLKYETKTAGPVSFEVRDLTGRLVMELNEGNQSAGTHAAVLDVSSISKGMYLYTLKSDKESVTCRMTVE